LERARELRSVLMLEAQMPETPWTGARIRR
jgi:hypothetical protein